MLKKHAKLFRVLFGVCNFFQSSLLQFRSNPINLTSPNQYSRLLKQHKIKYKVHLILLFVIFIQIIFVETQKKVYVFEKILYTVTSLMVIASNVYTYKFRCNGKKVCDFFNGIQAYSAQKMSHNSKPKLLSKISIHLAYLLPLTPIPLISFVIGIHLLESCRPSLIGFFLLNECSYFSTSSQSTSIFLVFEAVKWSVFALNIWVHLFGFSAMITFISVVNLICSRCMTQMIEVFPIFATTHHISNLNKCVCYRRIQLLVKVFNEIQEYMLTSGLLCCILGMSVCTCVFILFPWTAENGPLLLCMMVLLLDTFLVILVVAGGFASIAKESSMIRERIFRLVSKTVMSKYDNRENRVFCNSQIPLHIELGKMNWVDTLTSLKSIDLANDWSIQFLLLFKN